MRNAFVMGVAVVLAGAGRAAAQAPPEVEPGARVRVELRCGEGRIPERTAGARSCFVVGTLVGLSPTALTVDGGDGPSTYGLDLVAALQTSRGTGSRARVGAALGALVGGAASFIVLHHGGSTSWCDRSANQDAIGRRECVGLMVLGPTAGAGLGAWIGSRSRTERWRAVPLSAR